MSNPLVIVESPFAGDIFRNVHYLRCCLHDCFQRGEFPFASHAIYTQPGILNDAIPEERKLGIEAGLAWGAHAEKTVVYIDLGVSAGMQQGIDHAIRIGREIEFRSLPEWKNANVKLRA